MLQPSDMTPPLNETPTPEPLCSVFAALEIPVTSYNHEAIYTVEQGRYLHKALPGGHTKNLFLKDKHKNLWLVVALEQTVINLKALAKFLDCGRLSFGSPDLLQQFLGVTPGSVTPFGLINDPAQAVRPVLDQAMMQENPLYFHPLTNTISTAIAPQDLQKFIKAQGHKAPVVDFTQI